MVDGRRGGRRALGVVQEEFDRIERKDHLRSREAKGGHRAFAEHWGGVSQKRIPGEQSAKAEVARRSSRVSAIGRMHPIPPLCLQGALASAGERLGVAENQVPSHALAALVAKASQPATGDRTPRRHRMSAPHQSNPKGVSSGGNQALASVPSLRRSLINSAIDSPAPCFRILALQRTGQPGHLEEKTAKTAE
ncbi:MAG: hypothetical protein JWO08_4217 [Verrucomicrobiaceae bacterium]|nr:hypothetical protein [Verrucomicrobiaceae bacterium]